MAEGEDFWSEKRRWWQAMVLAGQLRQRLGETYLSPRVILAQTMRPSAATLRCSHSWFTDRS